MGVKRRFSNRRAEVKLYPVYPLAKKARVRPQSARSRHSNCDGFTRNLTMLGTSSA